MESELRRCDLSDIKWIKITTDIFDDEKILLIESMPDADAIIVIWFKLLCLAGKQNNSGVFLMNGRIAYTDEMLATIFRRKVSTVRLALQTFENFGMVEIVNGTITIPNWGKHQSIDKIEARNQYQKEYMREYRRRQALMADRALLSDDSKPNCKPNGEANSKANVSGTDKIREDKNKIREEEKEEPPALSSLSIEEMREMCEEKGMSLPIIGKMMEWVAYRGENYGDVFLPKRFNSLISNVLAKSKKYGEEAVINQIGTAIDNHWKGMNLDKIKVESQRPKGRFNQMETQDYDFEAIEMALTGGNDGQI